MKILIVAFILVSIACRQSETEERHRLENDGNTLQITTKAAITLDSSKVLKTGSTSPQDVINFSKTLIGVPYRYASADPALGFDCSGFIMFVFNHFNIEVPRTSAGFTSIEKEINITDVEPGDIILFTGTDSSVRQAGHIGIVTSVADTDIQFIHSSSGKANGVTITSLNNYYRGRFLKIIRVFATNDSN